MELSLREVFGLIHGIVLGSVFLLSYGASMVWLRSYNEAFLTDEGRIIRNKRMLPFIWVLCAVCWLTVITGTFISYPWYRAVPPEGADLHYYPQALLASSTETLGWHAYGMEWKEHVAWFSPFIFTAVAVIATLFGEEIAKDTYLRKALMTTLTIAFISAAIAALLGALITKKAPIL